MAFGYLTPYRRRNPARASQQGGGSLFDLHNQINRLFDDVFDQDGDTGFYGRSGMAAPAMDINRAEDSVEITAELPGVKEEDIDLTVEDGVLTLRGEKKSTRRNDETGYRERSYGSFERRISLPANIDEDKCSADFEDGVLTITLPVSEKKDRGRRIPLGKGKGRDTRSEDMLIEQDENSSSKNKKKDQKDRQTEDA